VSDHPLSIVKVTWLATYRNVLAETGNEGEVIFEADRSVRRAHGSSARTDLYNKQVLVDPFKGKRDADDLGSSENFTALYRRDWSIKQKETPAAKPGLSWSDMPEREPGAHIFVRRKRKNHRVEKF
jgi:hypothetical protein